MGKKIFWNKYCHLPFTNLFQFLQPNIFAGSEKFGQNVFVIIFIVASS